MNATRRESHPASKMDEFGYAQCSRCNAEFLRFTLTDGRCDFCAAADRTMQERHPIDREVARRGFTE